MMNSICVEEFDMVFIPSYMFKEHANISHFYCSLSATTGHAQNTVTGKKRDIETQVMQTHVHFIIILRSELVVCLCMVIAHDSVV